MENKETTLGKKYLDEMVRSNNGRAVLYCYRKLYKLATPSVGFDKLVLESPINEEGQIDIPFMDYQVEDKFFREVIEEASKKFKVDKKRLSVTIYLGCSPKSIYK